MSFSDQPSAFYRRRAEWRLRIAECSEINHAESRFANYWADKFVNSDTGSAWVSSDKLASFVGVSSKTVDRTFAKLEKLGFIERLGFKGRARDRRMIFKKTDDPGADRGDFGHQCPESETSLETDFGHSDARLRTNEGRTSDTQVRQTNEPIEPNEGAVMSTENATKLASGSRPSEGTFEQTSEFQRRQFRDKWESRIRSECRKEDLDVDYCRLRDEDKELLAWSLEVKRCELVDVIAEVRKLRNARSGPGQAKDVP